MSWGVVWQGGDQDAVVGRSRDPERYSAFPNIEQVADCAAVAATHPIRIMP